jgi:hypothetical protein
MSAGIVRPGRTVEAIGRNARRVVVRRDVHRRAVEAAEVLAVEAAEPAAMKAAEAAAVEAAEAARRSDVARQHEAQRRCTEQREPPRPAPLLEQRCGHLICPSRPRRSA